VVSKNTYKNNPIILGMASRFESQKKIVELILLIKAYNKKYNEKIFLELAGNGSMINEILAIKDENIHYVGELQRNQMENWYQNIDVYIHLSHWETDSISINEAIANSLPVICNKINGVYGNEQYFGLIDFLESETEDSLNDLLLKIKARNNLIHIEKVNEFVAIRSLDYIAQEYINCMN
jgi:glycosyltransferase involved in cell wall biosynthesis